jgi:GNAT superfamily N-acetyltransferase
VVTSFELTGAAPDIVLREATEGDLSAIVELLAADQLGATRDGIADEADRQAYLVAFRAISADPAHLLLVAERDGREIVGTFQLSFLPGLARRGAWRSQIEGVRVAAAERGAGLGAALMTWAVEESRRHGCVLVQLTTDKARTDAHRFYRRLGFVDSHEGMKLRLSSAAT